MAFKPQTRWSCMTRTAPSDNPVTDADREDAEERLRREGRRRMAELWVALGGVGQNPYDESRLN